MRAPAVLNRRVPTLGTRQDRDLTSDDLKASVRSRWNRRTVLHGATLVLIFVGLSFVFSLLATHTVPRSADNATVLLEGLDISRGNVLLHHWLLSLDSFWTVDALVYAAGTRVVGLNFQLLFVVPAVMMAAVVFTATACVSVPWRSRSWLFGAITVLMLLALPSPLLAYFLLQGPWHLGTALWALGAFYLVTRQPFRWGWLAAACMLALALVGDLVALAIGIVPCVFAGVVWLVRDRAGRQGLAAISCGIAATALAYLIRVVASRFGSFSYAYRNVPLHWHNIWHNLSALANRLSAFFGVTNLDITGIAPQRGAERALHLIGAGVVAVGLIAALRRSLLGPRLRDATPRLAIQLGDLLLGGVLGSIALFVFASPTSRTSDTTFLTAGVIYSIILAGIAMNELVAHLTSQPDTAATTRVRWTTLRGRTATTVGVGLSVVIALYFVSFLTEFKTPHTNEATRQLGSFLVAHDLTDGFGDYPTASLVTIATKGAANVRPLIPGRGGHLVADDRQVATNWYDRVPFTFFVYDYQQPWRDVTATRAIHTFGSANDTYTVGPFRILVWNQPITVKPPVPHPGSPLNIK